MIFHQILIFKLFIRYPSDQQDINGVTSILLSNNLLNMDPPLRDIFLKDSLWEQQIILNNDVPILICEFIHLCARGVLSCLPRVSLVLLSQHIIYSYEHSLEICLIRILFSK